MAAVYFKLCKVSKALYKNAFILQYTPAVLLLHYTAIYCTLLYELA